MLIGWPPTTTSSLANRGKATCTTERMPEQLLDDRVDAPVSLSGSATQPVPQVAVLQQHRGAEREHRGAGLEAAGEHAVGEAAEVEVVDLVAVLADDLADQAGSRVVPLPGGLGEQEVAGAADRTDGAGAALGDVEARRRQRAERLPLLVGHAEQVADHQERHRERVRRHQVDRAVARGRGALHLVELVLDDRLDPGTEPAEPPHRELGGQQLAQPGVLRRVGEPETAEVAVGGRAAAAHVGADVGGVRRRVAEQLTRLGVPGDQPDVDPEERGQLVHRGLVAHLSQAGGRRHHVPLQRPGEGVGHLVEPGQVDAVRARDQRATYRTLDC